MELVELHKILHRTNLGIMNSPRLKDHEKGNMLLNDVSILGILKNQKKQGKRKNKKAKIKVNVNAEFLNESVKDLIKSCKKCQIQECESCKTNPYLLLEGK